MKAVSKCSENMSQGSANIPLGNPFSNQIHYLSPGQPFYELIALTYIQLHVFDVSSVELLIEIFKRLDIKKEFEKITKIKKQPKFKANILYAMMANLEVLGEVVVSDSASLEKLNCIIGAKKVLKVLNDLVQEHSKEFGSEYDRVCASLVESSVMVEVYIEQYYFTEKNYAQAVNKAKSAIEQLQTVKSRRLDSPIIDLYADIAVSQLHLKEEMAAIEAFQTTVTLFKAERSKKLGMKERIMTMIEEFLGYYNDKNHLMLIKIVAVANELSLDDKEFKANMIEINNLVFPYVSGFFVEKIITSPDLLALAEASAHDTKSGALLIKCKNSELLSYMAGQLRKTTQKFSLLASEDNVINQYDLSIKFDGQRSTEEFLSFCKIAVRECNRPRSVRPKSTIAPVVNEVKVDEDPYAYAENLSDDMGQQRAAVTKKGRKLLQSSLEFFKKEISARKKGELKSPETISVAFKKTGCQYNQNANDSAVAMQFQGNNDVYYAILNPLILNRLPPNVCAQISDKFKSKIWAKAEFEDCRHEMKTKSAKTGRKDLEDWIFKIRILGHEFGDIRIYGKVIETVENPNKPGHFCQLVAFTGIADNGHKNLPECLEMPKLKKPSSSEEDDTCSMSDETGDSHSHSSGI